ncbi:hypothetical protein [Agrobacterium sp.]|uniref:hypothetical protein n=1 Tax=Agrobacterium sp. TaxID=361 RepID=UPI00289DE6D6|nr:hypothetical protein [Agrobacterium sp.]
MTISNRWTAIFRCVLLFTLVIQGVLHSDIASAGYQRSDFLTSVETKLAISLQPADTADQRSFLTSEHCHQQVLEIEQSESCPVEIGLSNVVARQERYAREFLGNVIPRPPKILVATYSDFDHFGKLLYDKTT